MMMNYRMLSLGAMTLALSLFVVSAPTFAAKEVKDGPHAAHMTKCAAICADCQVQCEACFKHVPELGKTYRGNGGTPDIA